MRTICPASRVGIRWLVAKLNCVAVDKEINDTNFPGADANVDAKNVVVIEMDPTWAFSVTYALKYLKLLGLKPVNPDKGFVWATAHKKVLRKHSVIIFGQLWRYNPGWPRVAILIENSFHDGRRASLCQLDEYYDFGCREESALPRSIRILAEPE